MDTIWDRKILRSRRSLAGGDEKTEWSRKTDKSRTLKKNIKI